MECDPIVTIRSSPKIFTSFMLLPKFLSMSGSINGILNVWLLPLRKCVFSHTFSEGKAIIALELMDENDDSINHIRSACIYIGELIIIDSGSNVKNNFLHSFQFKYNILRKIEVECYTFLTAKFIHQNTRKVMFVPSSTSSELEIHTLGTDESSLSMMVTPNVPQNYGTIISYYAFILDDQLRVLLGFESGICTDYNVSLQDYLTSDFKAFNSMVTCIYVSITNNRIYCGSTGAHLKIYHLADKTCLASIELDILGFHYILPVDNDSLLIIPWVGIGVKKVILNQDFTSIQKIIPQNCVKDNLFDGITNAYIIGKTSPNILDLNKLSHNLKCKKPLDNSQEINYLVVLFDRDIFSIYKVI